MNDHALEQITKGPQKLIAQSVYFHTIAAPPDLWGMTITNGKHHTQWREKIGLI